MNKKQWYLYILVVIYGFICLLIGMFNTTLLLFAQVILLYMIIDTIKKL